MGTTGRSYEWNSWQKVRVTADTLYAWIRSCPEVTGNFDARRTEIRMRLFLIRSCPEVTGNFDARRTEIRMRLFYINYWEAGKRRSSISSFFFFFFLSRAQLFCFVLCCSFTNCPRWFDLASITFCRKSHFFLVLILFLFSSAILRCLIFLWEIDHSSSHTGDSSHEKSCRNLKNSLDTVYMSPHFF